MNKELNKSANEENDSPEMNSKLSLHNPMSMRSNSIKMKNNITKQTPYESIIGYWKPNLKKAQKN